MTSLARAHPAVRFWRPETDADSLPGVLSTSGSLAGTLLPLLLLLELRKPESEPGFLCWHKGFKLRSSSLHGKHFYPLSWVPSPGCWAFVMCSARHSGKAVPWIKVVYLGYFNDCLQRVINPVSTNGSDFCHSRPTRTLS